MSDALSLWRACEGKTGLQSLERLSGHAIQAIGIISHAHSEKMSEDIKESREKR